MPDFTKARTIHLLRGDEFYPLMMPLQEAVYGPNDETFANRACNKARSMGARFFIIPSVWIGGSATRFRAYDVANATCGLDTTNRAAAEMWCIHREHTDG
jgi:hypothetical protein